MKMQTMRNVLALPDNSSAETPTRALLLPPLAAFSVARPAVRVEEKPQIKDMAQKRAGEVYSTMMAGVAYRTQNQGR